MQDQDDTSTTLTSAVQLLVQNVEACEAAGVSIVTAKRRVETPAASNEVAMTANELQMTLGQGPCLDAIWKHEIVDVPDLAVDGRWSRWGPQLMKATGVRSVLCYRLYTTGETLGALSMYASMPDAFSAEDREEGLALAAYIALAVSASSRAAQLQLALDSRTVTAQAIGIVMERFQMDADGAFALLTRVSSTHNIKLREVAAELVRTGELPRAKSPRRVSPPTP